MNINFYGSSSTPPTMDRVCRICLTETENLSSIYTQNPVNPTADITLPQKIQLCGGIELNENDNLPSLICEICSYNACVAHGFRQQCQNSDQRLRLYYDKPSRTSSIESGTQTDLQLRATYHNNKPLNNQNDYYIKQELHNINNQTLNNAIGTVIYQQQQQSEQQVQQQPIINNTLIETEEKIFLCQLGYDNTKELSNKNTVIIESPQLENQDNCLQNPSGTNCLTNNNAQVLIATDGQCEQRIHAVVDESLLQSTNKSSNSDEYFNGHILVTADGVVVAKPSEQVATVPSISAEPEEFSEEDEDEENEEEIDDDNDNMDADEIDIPEDEEEPKKQKPDDEIRQRTMRKAKSTNKSYNDDANDDDDDDEDIDDPYPITKNDTEQPTHSCKLCSKKYTTIKGLNSHLQSHDKKYKCKTCARSFFKYDNLNKHEKIHDTKPHACQQCHTSFTKPQSLARHLKSHDNNKLKINDNIKNETKSDNDDVDNEGLLNNDSPGIFKCTNCGQICSSLKNLKRHSLLHGNKKYSCTVCVKWFYRPDTLKKHAEKHGHGLLDNLMDDNKLYESDDDNFSQGGLTNVTSSSGGGGGGVKNNSTKVLNDVNKLLNSEDDDDDDGDEDDDGIIGGEYKCQHCDKIMQSKKGLRRHVSLHKPKAEPVTCGICKKICASQARLALHQKTHNKPKEKIPREYLCHVCSKVYPSNSSLTYHMRTHTGVKPHVCTICGSRFTTTTSLANHTRIHTGDKPFVCHVCSAAFAVSSAFRRHMTRHTGEANYLCKTCGKKFKRLSTLKEHTYTHSGEKPYVCKTCGAAYSHSGSLFAHQKRCKVQYGDGGNDEQQQQQQQQNQHHHQNVMINHNQLHVSHHIHVNNVPTAVRSLGVIGPMF